MKDTSSASGPAELRDSLWVDQAMLRRCVARAWVAGLLVLVSTVYMFEVYDRVVNSRNVTTLVMLTLMVLGSYALMEALEANRQGLLRGVAAHWDQRLSARLHALAQKLARQGQAPAGVQLLGDFRSLRDALSNPFVGALMESPLALVFLLILFAFHPLLGWSALLGAAAQVMLTLWNERRSRERLQRANQAASIAQQYADETLQHHEVVAAMGMHDAVHRRWAQWQDTLVEQQARASEHAGAAQAAGKWIQTVLSSALLGLSAYLLLKDSLPGGGGLMIVASVLGGRVLAPLMVLVTQWRTVAQVQGAWRRVSAVLAQHPAAPTAMPLPAPKGYLTAERIWVAPVAGGTALLRDVRLSLPPGQCLAVLGPSGAGKSTLLRALVGFWPCVQGSVRLDSVDVATWDKAELGRHIGYLPQDVNLMDGTVAQNVARFDEFCAADDVRLEAALRAAGLTTVLQAWPEGAQTPVGPQGRHLSGGQRVRVGLARAFFGQPRLVVLDEPTAHLDEAGEREVLAMIAQLKAAGASVVLTTHRTGLLAQADQLLLLRDGAVQAYGPTQQVLAALQQAAVKAQQGAGHA